MIEPTESLIFGDLLGGISQFEELTEKVASMLEEPEVLI